jgi:predicted small metal-binding protein
MMEARGKKIPMAGQICFNCAKTSWGCDAYFCADSEEELLDEAMEHVAREHGADPRESGLRERIHAFVHAEDDEE